MLIDALLERLKGPDMADRDEAAADLEDLASDGLGGPLLVAALGQNHGRVRREAARALGLMRQSDPETIGALCSLFAERSDKLKREAARALARIGYDAVPALLELLQDENHNAYARSYIIWALGQIKAPTCQEPLMALFWESRGVVAKMLARALARIDFQSTLHSFSESARGWDYQRDPERGRSGLLQLGIAAPDPVDIIEATVMGGDSLTAFEISQGKGNHQVLLGAIRGLGERRDETRASIGVLLDALEYEDRADIRQEAVLALRRIEGAAVRQGTLRSFQDRHLGEGARSSAARLLGLLRERQALGPFRDALCDLNSPIQLRSSIALAYPRFRDATLLSDLLQGLTTLLRAEDEAPEQLLSAQSIHFAIGQIAAQRYPETLRFALLREALSCPPHGLSWQAVTIQLDHWPEDQNRELAITYANQHREQWAESAEQPLTPYGEESSE